MAGRRSKDRASRSRGASATSRRSEASPSACTSNRRTSISNGADRREALSKYRGRSQEGRSSGDSFENLLSSFPLVKAFLLRDPDDDGGHVVVWRRFAAPLGHCGEDRVDDRLGRLVVRSADDLEQPLGGEFLAGFV